MYHYRIEVENSDNELSLSVSLAVYIQQQHVGVTTVIVAGFVMMDVKQSTTSSLSVNSASSFPILCSTEYGSPDSSPAAEDESCAENAENVEADSSIHEVVNTAEAPSSSVRSTSPDLNCPICLGRLENRSYTDTCFHKFCFVCLVEWSKVKPVCPLCKQPFTSVIHSVQSYEDFEQLPITPANSGTPAAADSNRSRFRYPTTVIRGRSERRRQRDSLHRPSRLCRRGSSRFDVPPPAFTSSFRRSIYRDELWVRSVEDSGRYRDVSAAFFARNPTAVHRLMPWLNRELMALLRNPADVSFLLEVICSTVLRVDIMSETFYDLVAPFIGARTRHFIHEFYTFARSPFNMEAYDTRVIYERPPQIASGTPIEFSDSSSSSDSSDDDIVEINSLAAASESDQVVNDEGAAGNDNVFSVGDSQQNVSRSILPQPGPSHLQDIPLPSTSTSAVSCQSHYSHAWNTSGQSSHGQSSSPSDRHELSRNMEENVEDASDDVEIVAEDKPWGDRSPVVLSSSDTDAEADNVNELAHQATGSTVDTYLLNDVGLEVSPVFEHRTVAADSSEHDITELAFSSVQMNRAELAGSITGSTHSSKKSSHHSKHHHKRARKHKHRHHRDSSRQQKDDVPHHSSSGSHSKKSKRQSRMLKPDDDIIASNELKHTPSASVSYTSRAPDGFHTDSTVWLSDDSNDSSSESCQPVRSVVVVPQTFKKNPTGHKRSATDWS